MSEPTTQAEHAEQTPTPEPVFTPRVLTPGEIRSRDGWGTLLEPGGALYLKDLAQRNADGPVVLEPDGVPALRKLCPGCRGEIRFRCETPPSPLFVRLVQRAMCDSCIEKAIVADERRAVHEAMRERVADSRIPKSLISAVSWDSLIETGTSPAETEKRRRAIEQAREWAECRDFRERKQGLLLYGEPGTGKTRLMATAVATRLEHSPMRWISVGVLIAELQGAWNDDDRKAALKVLTSKAPVALDDLDKVNATDSVRMQLFTALDKREQSGSPLIVTTNCKPSELSKKLGDAMASRLVGMCVVASYPGPDRRLELGRD